MFDVIGLMFPNVVFESSPVQNPLQNPTARYLSRCRKALMSVNDVEALLVSIFFRHGGFAFEDGTP